MDTSTQSQELEASAEARVDANIRSQEKAVLEKRVSLAHTRETINEAEADLSDGETTFSVSSDEDASDIEIEDKILQRTITRNFVACNKY